MHRYAIKTIVLLKLYKFYFLVKKILKQYNQKRKTEINVWDWTFSPFVSCFTNFVCQGRQKFKRCDLVYVWLVVLGLTTLSDSISVFIGPSPRERERERRELIDERKNVQTTPLAPTASTLSPCLTVIQTSRPPRHWKTAQNNWPGMNSKGRSSWSKEHIRETIVIESGLLQ